MKIKTENLGKVSITVEKDFWNIDKAYDRLTIVERQGTSGAYISRKAVPVGVSITDRNYWIPIGKWSDVPYPEIDPVPTRYSTNSVQSGGVFDALQMQDAIEASFSDDGKIYNNYKAGDIFYIEQDGVHKYRVAYFDGTADEEHPITIDGLHFYFANNASDAIFKSILIKNVSTTQQQLTSTQKSTARENIAAVAYEKQELTSNQQVQLQNNMIGKKYVPADFSGLGKKVFAKNVQTVSGVDKNIMTQAFFEDEQGNPLTNTVFIIQYDYDLMGETIEIPEGCKLNFDGGSLSNGTLQIRPETVIKTDDVKIFDNLFLTGSVSIGPNVSYNLDELNVCWFGATPNDLEAAIQNSAAIQKAIESAGSIGAGVYFPKGRYEINSPIIVPSNTRLRGYRTISTNSLSGRGYETQLHSDTAECLIQIGESSAADNVIIENFYLTGRSSLDMDGIVITDGITRSSISNVLIYFTNHAIKCVLSNNKGFSTTNLKDIEILSCKRGIYIDNETETNIEYCTANKFEHIKISKVKQFGVYVKCNRGIQDLVLDHCDISNVGFKDSYDAVYASSDVFGMYFEGLESKQSSVCLRDCYLENIKYTDDSYRKVSGYDYDSHNAVFGVKNVDLQMYNCRFANTWTVVISKGDEVISMFGCIDNGYHGNYYEAICVANSKTRLYIDFYDFQFGNKDIVKGPLSVNNAQSIEVAGYRDQNGNYHENIKYNKTNCQKTTIYLSNTGTGCGLLSIFPTKIHDISYTSAQAAIDNPIFNGIDDIVFSINENISISKAVYLYCKENAVVSIIGNDKTLSSSSSVANYIAFFGFAKRLKEINISNLVVNCGHDKAYLLRNSNTIFLNVNISNIDIKGKVNSILAVDNARTFIFVNLYKVSSNREGGINITNATNLVKINTMSDCYGLTTIDTLERITSLNTIVPQNYRFNGFVYYNDRLNTNLCFSGQKDRFTTDKGFTAALVRGTTAKRPVGRYILQSGATKPTSKGFSIYIGFTFLDTSDNKYYIASAINGAGNITWVEESTVKENVPSDAPRTGTTAQRPSAEYAYNNLYVGFDYFDTTLNWFVYISELTRTGDGTESSPYEYHITWSMREYYTNIRSAITSDDIGFEYFDITLGKPIYASAVSDDGIVTWVDATGATV